MAKDMEAAWVLYRVCIYTVLNVSFACELGSCFSTAVFRESG